MPSTPRMGYTYGAEGQDPYYVTFEARWNQVDADQWADREDANLILKGGGNIVLDAGADELSWTENLDIISTLTEGIVRILPATLTGFEAGKIAYVEIGRPVEGLQIKTMSVGDTLASNRNYLFLAIRVGDVVYFRNEVNKTALAYYDFSGTQKVTTASAASGGGTVDGSMNIGVESGQNWRVQITALGNTVDSTIQFYSDAGMTDLLYEAANKDCYTTPYDDRTGWWFGTLTDGLLYYNITNDGANASEYEIEIIGNGRIGS